MANQRQLALGAFFVVVLTLLGVYTLFLTDFSLFRERHQIVVHFPQANGLRQGDTVLVAGIRAGRVQSLTYDPAAPLERRVTVTLSMDTQVLLRTGYDISIADATVLGGKQLVIDPGPFDGASVATNVPLPGRVRGSALDGLGKLVDENGSKLSTLVDDLQVMVADARAGKGTVGRLMRDDALADELSAGVSSARKSFDNIQAFTDDVRAGKGLLGRLATDEDLASRFSEVMSNLEQISKEFEVVSGDVAAGKGVIGRLVKDEKLGEDVSAAVATIKDITSRINNADGSLWKLIEDGEIADRLKEFAGKLDEGTLGKLFTNDELYTKISKVADDLSAASGALKNAEGTLGKLLMDKELYAEVQKALSILTRTLQEYREAAPVTAFSTILFQSF
jgi:phospholipid/cholesterol/gamma-HCH transport system substrate-binding protein